MSAVMIRQLKRVSAEMKVIMNKPAENGRKINREEQDLLEQLSAQRDEILSNIIVTWA